MLRELESSKETLFGLGETGGPESKKVYQPNWPCSVQCIHCNGHNVPLNVPPSPSFTCCKGTQDTDSSHCNLLSYVF